MDSFGNILKETRKESKFKTLDNLAKEIGVSRQSLGHYEAGARFPDTETLRRIALALEVSSDYLLGLTDVKSPDTSLRYICEETGLAEYSIIYLREASKMNKDDHFGFSAIFGFLDALIKSASDSDGLSLILKLSSTAQFIADADSFVAENNMGTPVNHYKSGLYWLLQQEFTRFIAENYDKEVPNNAEK